MKRKHVTLAVLLAALSFFAAPSATALPQSELLSIKKTVVDTPAAELAARAADLVTQASKADQEEVAVATVRDIAARRPATIVAVVGAISKANSEVSVAVAAEAAKLIAERASEIAKAAAAGAPSQASQIAAAVAKVAPKSATKVTRAVASIVPDQTTKVVETVLSSVPSARADIAKDATLTRMSQRMAADAGGNSGIITTLPGTINGTPAPNSPPLDVGTPTQGTDPNRKYGTP
jgi:hypothetical protein